MKIGGINNTKSISAIYTYGNSHFNQIQDVPVTPVKKIKGTQAVDRQEDRTKYAVVYGSDRTSETYDTKEVRTKYADIQNVSYNNIENPYEISKMERDSIILSGMNFDEYA